MERSDVVRRFLSREPVVAYGSGPEAQKMLNELPAFRKVMSASSKTKIRTTLAKRLPSSESTNHGRI